MSEGEDPKVQETDDDESCRPAVEEVRTSITTTTMKKGNYIDKEKAETEDDGEEKEVEELPEDIVEEIIEAGDE